MDVLHPRCCGLDVHKNSISACILVQVAGRVQKHQRRFSAMTQDLQELANWLRQFEVKAEDAKLQDAGISPKQWPKKMSGRKRLAYRTR